MEFFSFKVRYYEAFCLARIEKSNCHLSQWRHSVGISQNENRKDPILRLLVTFIEFSQTFVQRGRNRPCVSIIS